MSHNPMGIHDLLQEELNLFIQTYYLREQQLQLDNIIWLADRCLQDGIQQQNSIIISPDTNSFPISEQDLIMTRQIEAM
jgi:hypothetical protein